MCERHQRLGKINYLSTMEVGIDDVYYICKSCAIAHKKAIFPTFISIEHLRKEEKNGLIKNEAAFLNCNVPVVKFNDIYDVDYFQQAKELPDDKNFFLQRNREKIFKCFHQLLLL